MCSVNPDIEDDDAVNLMTAAIPIKSSPLCRKCKEVEPIVVLQSKFPYCRVCFIEMVSHKFFGCLGKSKTMKATDRVLLLCSGSQSCSVLLNLIKIGLHERQKRILSDAFVLFIDTGAFLPLSTIERIDLVKEINSMASYFGFKSFYSRLIYSKDGMKEMNDLSWLTQEFLDNNNISKDIVESLKTSTSKEDILIKLRESVAANVARELGCSKIFSADTNDHTATKILTNIALGRGDQLPLDIGFCDNRFEDVLILRPLRECSRKEIAFYRLLFNLPFVSYRKGGTAKGTDYCIQKLTEKFVAELQVSFPSTVSMVVGTGNKLSTKHEQIQNESVCALCKGDLKEYAEDELSAVSATRVSHLISTVGSQGFNSNNFTQRIVIQTGMDCTDKPCNQHCHCSSNNSQIEFDNIKNAFCYGCQLILKDMGNLEKLPSEILEKANKIMKLNAMKEEINDFLL